LHLVVVARLRLHLGVVARQHPVWESVQ